MLSRVIAAAVQGIEACCISVEVDIAPGLPTFATVGLPDASVKESKDRVVAAIRNSGYDFPAKRITVNLAPAEIKKEGSAFDLPIAVGILAAQEVVRKEGLDGCCLIGELALDGTLRPVKGVLPIVVSLGKSCIKRIVLPSANAPEAAVAGGVEIYPVERLEQVVRFLNAEEALTPFPSATGAGVPVASRYDLDFAEVKGQQFAKRALEVAAAGGHNLLLIGVPGSGKTMLARRLPTILPPFSFDEALESTKIHSVAGLLAPGQGLLACRPFRAPHHTISPIALAGGGTYPRPGEVSLSHNGVLFLDELPEFHRDVLEVLRQPMEDRTVTISRARNSLSFPASFMLVAAMNPCPCGNLGHPQKECRCTPYQVQKYRARISGPLLDRIDLHLEVPPLKIGELTDETRPGETSASIRERVVRAHALQKERFAGTGVNANSQMTGRELKKYCLLTAESGQLLRTAIERLSLSGRAYDRIIKVSRTIADLEGSMGIEKRHVAEAIQYRGLDRF